MSKTVDDLVRVFEIAHYGAANGPADKTRLRAGVRAVVRAVRDHIAPLSLAGKTFEVHDLLVEFDEILGDTAEARSAGVLAVESREGAMISEAPEAPVTDPAPAVCEWTLVHRLEPDERTDYRLFRMSCDGESYATGCLPPWCPSCGQTIKFTEAKT